MKAKGFVVFYHLFGRQLLCNEIVNFFFLSSQNMKYILFTQANTVSEGEYEGNLQNVSVNKITSRPFMSLISIKHISPVSGIYKSRRVKKKRRERRA